MPDGIIAGASRDILLLVCALCGLVSVGLDKVTQLRQPTSPQHALPDQPNVPTHQDLSIRRELSETPSPLPETKITFRAADAICQISMLPVGKLESSCNFTTPTTDELLTAITAVAHENARLRSQLDELLTSTARAPPAPPVAESLVSTLPIPCENRARAPNPQSGVYYIGDVGATTAAGMGYCDLTTTPGKGWQLLTVFRNAGLNFDGDSCRSLAAGGNCLGRLSSAYAAEPARLEMLVRYIDGSKWVTLSGFSSAANGFVQFMTGAKRISSSSSCTAGDHTCNVNRDTAFQITNYSGWTPVDLQAGLWDHIRLGGWWMGDSDGGGSGVDYQFDVGYGNYGGMKFRGDTDARPAAIFIRTAE